MPTPTPTENGTKIIASVSVRNIDAALWTQVNVEAAARQIPIGVFVSLALREYIAEHGLTTIKKVKK